MYRPKRRSFHATTHLSAYMHACRRTAPPPFPGPQTTDRGSQVNMRPLRQAETAMQMPCSGNVFLVRSTTNSSRRGRRSQGARNRRGLEAGIRPLTFWRYVRSHCLLEAVLVVRDGGRRSNWGIVCLRPVEQSGQTEPFAWPFRWTKLLSTVLSLCQSVGRRRRPTWASGSKKNDFGLCEHGITDGTCEVVQLGEGGRSMFRLWMYCYSIHRCLPVVPMTISRCP